MSLQSIVKTWNTITGQPIHCCNLVLCNTKVSTISAWLEWTFFVWARVFSSKLTGPEFTFDKLGFSPGLLSSVLPTVVNHVIPPPAEENWHTCQAQAACGCPSTTVSNCDRELNMIPASKVTWYCQAVNWDRSLQPGACDLWSTPVDLGSPRTPKLFYDSRGLLFCWARLTFRWMPTPQDQSPQGTETVRF